MVHMFIMVKHNLYNLFSKGFRLTQNFNVVRLINFNKIELKEHMKCYQEILSLVAFMQMLQEHNFVEYMSKVCMFKELVKMYSIHNSMEIIGYNLRCIINQPFNSNEKQF